MFRDRGVEIKSPEQIDAMRRAGLVVGRTLELLRTHVAAGVTTRELDGIAEDHIRTSGATPSFLGYHGFPGSICVSVNDEVVHGIPGQRVLADGDIVSIDGGAIVAGWHGDSARTVLVGTTHDPADQELSDVTRAAMWRGIAAMATGTHVGDIGRAVEDALARRKGKRIPMNIDGATAVIYAELGFPPPLCRGLFVLSRSVGALAHAWEQMQSGQRNKGPIPRRYLWRYDGPAPRPADG